MSSEYATTIEVDPMTGEVYIDGKEYREVETTAKRLSARETILDMRLSGNVWRCSSCGAPMLVDDCDFCPGCGRRMVER